MVCGAEPRRGNLDTRKSRHLNHCATSRLYKELWGRVFPRVRLRRPWAVLCNAFGVRNFPPGARTPLNGIASTLRVLDS